MVGGKPVVKDDKLDKLSDYYTGKVFIKVSIVDKDNNYGIATLLMQNKKMELQ